MFKILDTYSINNLKSLRNKQESKDDRCWERHGSDRVEAELEN